VISEVGADIEGEVARPRRETVQTGQALLAGPASPRVSSRNVGLIWNCSRTHAPRS
jgi:hypothetical protein